VSLVTRCPACGTAFRVQSAQLAAHSGTVRCGKCGGVFNGVAALVENAEERLTLEPSPQLGLFDPAQRAAEAPAAAADDELPEFLTASHSHRSRRVLWSAAIVAAACALALQVGYRYRAELAATMPAARPALQALCRPLDCQVPLPRRVELMSIEASELQADPRRDGLIVLTALIRNRARFAQDYPALELTLTDDRERPLLRRVLMPREYLEWGRAGELMARGIAGGGEAALRLLLDTSPTRATGYRLYLFYPV